MNEKTASNCLVPEEFDEEIVLTSEKLATCGAEDDIEMVDGVSLVNKCVAEAR